MTTLDVKDLPIADTLDHKDMAAVHGGRMKLPFQRVSTNDLLTDAVGDPVAVYVDGLLVNSVTTGYAPR